MPWVHHSRKEGSLSYDGGLVRLEVQTNFDSNINHQQSLFYYPSYASSMSHLAQFGWPMSGP
jgi:hypothetical protein